MIEVWKNPYKLGDPLDEPASTISWMTSDSIPVVQSTATCPTKEAYLKEWGDALEALLAWRKCKPECIEVQNHLVILIFRKHAYQPIHVSGQPVEVYALGTPNKEKVSLEDSNG